MTETDGTTPSKDTLQPREPSAAATAQATSPSKAVRSGIKSSDPNLEIEVALAVEDAAVLESSRARLVEARRRVLSHHLSGAALAPGNGEVFERTKQIDGHVVKLSAAPPLRTFLKTPEVPEELRDHLPRAQ